MAAGEWIEISPSSMPEEGKPVAVEHGDASILLARVEGRVHACAGKCTHFGGPLEQGRQCGREVVCPWHHARFDVTTGRMTAPPALDDLASFPVETRGAGLALRMVPARGIPKPSGSDSRRVLIVGAGAAGHAAAEMLRREGFAGPIRMITPERDEPYDRTSLSKGVLSGKSAPERQRLRGPGFYAERGIEILTGRRAVGLDARAKRVTTDDGQIHPFEFCLLASGGRPRTLPVPGNDLAGIFLLRNLEDARRIVAAAEKASRAVIVGGGFIGIECAASLRQRGLPVEVILREPAPLERVFGPRIGRGLARRHEANGIVFHRERTVSAFHGDGKVGAVELSDGRSVAGDLVILGLGIDLATEYLDGSGLLEGRAVAVDARLETRAPGIFAAGDIALVPHGYGAGSAAPARPAEGMLRLEHWAVAQRQGQHAARAMLGAQQPYTEVPFFWSRQGELSVKQVGFAPRPESFAYRGDVEAGKFLAGIYQQGHLRAAVGMGVVSQFQAVEQILGAGKDVPFERFEDVGFDLESALR